MVTYFSTDVKVNIEPSIEVKTILTSSQSNSTHYWLALEIENFSNSVITIPSLLVLSKHWSSQVVDDSTQDPRIANGNKKSDWEIQPQQNIRIFLLVRPTTRNFIVGEEIEETVGVLTPSCGKHVPLQDYYSQLVNGAWELPDFLTWKKNWVPAGESPTTDAADSELIVSDVPIFTFLHRERSIGALHERRIKLKNSITPPLATYIDGGSDHTEQDKKKKAEERRNEISTQCLVHVLVNWHMTTPDNVVCVGVTNLPEISPYSSVVETDERQAPLPKRRNSLVNLIEAKDELKLEKSPLLFTVASPQIVEGHDFEEGYEE